MDKKLTLELSAGGPAGGIGSTHIFEKVNECTYKVDHTGKYLGDTWNREPFMLILGFQIMENASKDVTKDYDYYINDLGDIIITLRDVDLELQISVNSNNAPTFQSISYTPEKNNDTGYILKSEIWDLKKLEQLSLNIYDQGIEVTQNYNGGFDEEGNIVINKK
ncbi:hypothetical protein ACFLY2_03655 [Patescibacteria group bacterium]